MAFIFVFSGLKMYPSSLWRKSMICQPVTLAPVTVGGLRNFNQQIYQVMDGK
jgi:hypothetical protein